MSATDQGRVDWVDYAKGFCIVMVVTMHSTLGVEKAAGEVGWMHAIADFTDPFRMPDFFLIAGLFLSRTVDGDWLRYIDRKALHFVYFYVLWLTIQFTIKAPGLLGEFGPIGTVEAYFLAYLEPFGTLWFIYLLPVFFVVTKLTRPLPGWLVLTAAAFLQIAPIHTGWLMIDEFAARFVYFYAGFLFAPLVFRIAAWAMANVWFALPLLGIWAFANGTLVALDWSGLPVVSLALGFLGAAAVVGLSALWSKSDLMAALRYCGHHSLIVYLAFFLPMAATRIVLLKSGMVSDVGTISLIVTLAGIIGPLILFWIVRGTPLAFLFERPGFARLEPRPSRLVPAE